MAKLVDTWTKVRCPAEGALLNFNCSVKRMDIELKPIQNGWLVRVKNYEFVFCATKHQAIELVVDAMQRFEPEPVHPYQRAAVVEPGDGQ